MKRIELPVVKIGNSRGIRLSASLLRKYGIQKTLLMEERSGEIVLRPKRSQKLSWKETFQQMAAEKESWKDFETTTFDGLDQL